jgi:hypothetical protein
MPFPSALYLMGVLFERGYEMFQQEERSVQASVSREVVFSLSPSRFIMFLCGASLVGACLFAWLEPLLTSFVLFVVKDVLFVLVAGVVMILLIYGVRGKGSRRKQERLSLQGVVSEGVLLSRRVLYRDYREKFSSFMCEYPEATLGEIMHFFGISQSAASDWRLRYKKEQGALQEESLSV